MKIVVVGGGSGGHLTPLLAVAQALKDNELRLQVFAIGQKGEGLQEVLHSDAIDGVHAISAGKFRRYHGESFLQHITDFRTIALNVRDFFRFLAGFWQAWRLLGKIKPDCIFLKGGFVCVPVGFAARLRNIPYITHDSDAIPGLSNRLTAKNAVYNTTALPPEIYPYPKKKTLQVGIPLRPEFSRVSAKNKTEAKEALGIKRDQPVIFCVGGGLGARKLNQAMSAALPDVLKAHKHAVVVHITGKKLFEETKKLYADAFGGKVSDDLRLIDFTSELSQLSAAADVIVTRAGATNMAEFAAQAKPCVVVPGAQLTGGQQLHNAEILTKNKAAVVVYENELEKLSPAIVELLSNEELRQQLANKLNELFVDGAADKIAELLLEIADKRNRGA